MAEYIRREDVIERLVEAFKLQAETAKAIVDAIPAADALERKHGKWILVEDYSTEEIEDGEKYWVCSLCGCGSDSYDTTYHTNYCPNCGADMRGEDDG